MKPAIQHPAARISMLMYRQRHMPGKKLYNHIKVHEHIRGIEEKRMRHF